MTRVRNKIALGSSAYTKKYRDRLKEEGMCVRCREPHERGTALCKSCSGERYMNTQKTKAALTAAGKCWQCSSVLDGKSKTRCNACRVKRRKEQDDRIAAGICNMCRKNRIDEVGKRTCKTCRAQDLERTRQRRADLEDNNLCLQCTAERPGTAKYCGTCRLKAEARMLLGSTCKWVELDALFQQQGGRCFYTGQSIDLCAVSRAERFKGASLDHIIPSARGGGNEVANFQWTSWAVNRAKHDLTHDEFIAMCVAVAARHGPQQTTASVSTGTTDSRRRREQLDIFQSEKLLTRKTS